MCIRDSPYSQLDFAITLCGDAAENCPFVPNIKIIHWGLPDPAKASDKEAMEIFRKIRDDIKKKVEELIKKIP